MTSKYQNWETPPKLFRYLDREFNFTLDAAAEHSTAKCDRYFTPEDNGLEHSWKDERVWLNPPYGYPEIEKWIKKAYEEKDRAELIVLLIPPNTDTGYWHDYVMKADEIRFIKGRVNFWKDGQPPPGNATMPSCIIVFDECSSGYPDIGQILDYENHTLEGVSAT